MPHHTTSRCQRLRKRANIRPRSSSCDKAKDKGHDQEWRLIHFFQELCRWIINSSCIPPLFSHKTALFVGCGKKPEHFHDHVIILLFPHAYYFQSQRDLSTISWETWVWEPRINMAPGWPRGGSWGRVKVGIVIMYPSKLSSAANAWQW